jgi:NADH-dependent peroxiredoxin subunit F
MNSTKKKLPLDLVIIGAAAAGCTAAVYAARRHLNFVVLSEDIGGEVAKSGEVENWPGIIHTTGIELSQQFYKHAQSYDVDFQIGTRVESISQEGNIQIVRAKNGGGEEVVYKTKSVIIATGIHPRELGIPGELPLRGKGVTYCTVCDGPLFKGKTTATVGAGSAALESALMMSEIANKVYLITKYPENKKGGFPKGEDILVKKIKEKDNVEIIYEAATTAIVGASRVEGLTYTDEAGAHELNIDATMVHIGMIPNSDFVSCTKKNALKEIEINIKTETSCAGIFAAGDVTDIPHKQISIAAGHGATAALTAIQYLNAFEE